MMILRSLMIVSIVFISSSSFAGRHKVIYGSDDRLDFYEESSTVLRELSRSTAAMIYPKNLRGVGDKTVITAQSHGVGYGLCKEEPFFEQPIAADCSAFLVGPKTLVTAGHCVRDQSGCESVRFVFDYKLENAGQSQFEVSNSQVYKCKKLIKSVFNAWGGDKTDYAVIELEREVTDRSPLKFRTSGKISDHEDLVVMGHPSGLPLKIAGGAYVRSNTHDIYFDAT